MIFESKYRNQAYRSWEKERAETTKELSEAVQQTRRKIKKLLLDMLSPLISLFKL